jgi:transposase
MNDHTIETIGCDLGDKLSAIFLIGPDGRTERARVKTTRAAMEEFFRRPAAHVVIEVGNHSRWVSHLVQELGHRVTIANPRRVKAISESDTKTDRADAELLARLGRADQQLLAPVQHEGDKRKPTSPC